VAAAQSRCPKQLAGWLLRLVVRLEPLAFEQGHRRALAERRVIVVQGVDGIGYVTGEVSAADAAAIDGLLVAGARDRGADDPRTEQQRRSDLFADLLLGRLHLSDNDQDETSHAAATEDSDRGEQQEWLDVEDIDPDTGELLGTHRQAIDPDGEAIGEPIDRAVELAARLSSAADSRSRQIRIGVVVPLSSLLALNDTPGELTDRSGLIPGSVLRELIAEALDPDRRDHVLFTRLLTDDSGRLMDTTELGRYASSRLAQAIKVRAATCRFPSCTVPADCCDLDHHQPWPDGKPQRRTWIHYADATTAAKPSPGWRASGTTMPSTGPCPTPNGTDVPTSRYQQGPPAETPRLHERRDLDAAPLDASERSPS